MDEPAESDPHGLDPHTPGAKMDAGKPPLRLILQAMPRALLAVAKVGGYGAQKYTESGWLHVDRGIERYTDAMLRHVVSEGIGHIDPESGFPHAAHAAWGALARLELMLRAQEHEADESDG